MSPLYSRRRFLQSSAAAAAVFTSLDNLQGQTPAGEQANSATSAPWYKKITRWGQVNITEKDPEQYDIGWWKKYWKKTNTGGIIINAGGIVAYYPSKIPFHRQASFLKGADLFGELRKAAQEEGLAVFARMDSNRAHEELYNAHPDWFAVDANKKPYRAADLYHTCIFGPYYSEHIPAVLKEIAALYKPEGFTDNSWSGIGRDMICYCDNCRTAFLENSGYDLPRTKNWDDEVYRKWIMWNYAKRIQTWELNNKVTKESGGDYCTWAGMNSGSITSQCRSFRDFREISKRADIIMLDHQSRGSDDLLQHNTETGLLIHELAGQSKLIPESMAMYQAGRPTFRLSSKPMLEARMWMINGFAGGIQPWWHHVSAYHEDRRMYDTAGTVMSWHKDNEELLINRQPVASVGVVWSQRNTDFYGKDNPNERVDLPWKGVTRALVRARIPYIPIHADDIQKNISRFSLLIFPNIGALSDAQVAATKSFVAKGGNILATGDTSLYDEWGIARDDFALADIFGVHKIKGIAPLEVDKIPKLAWNVNYHTYLRLNPELRIGVEGPKNGNEPSIAGERHPVLKGFEKTDILPFGGFVEKLKADSGVIIPFTFIPQFPVYPPETAWMRETKTDIGGMFVSERRNGARIVYLPADIDRQYGNFGLPDHGDLLKNLFMWTAGDSLPFSIDGKGLINCTLYRQSKRLIMHLVNQTSISAWNPPLDELISVGPLSIQVKLPVDIAGRNIKLRVQGKQINGENDKGSVRFTLESLLDHEMVVIS